MDYSILPLRQCYWSSGISFTNYLFFIAFWQTSLRLYVFRLPTMLLTSQHRVADLHDSQPQPRHVDYRKCSCGNCCDCSYTALIFTYSWRLHENFKIVACRVVRRLNNFTSPGASLFPCVCLGTCAQYRTNFFTLGQRRHKLRPLLSAPLHLVFGTRRLQVSPRRGFMSMYAPVTTSWNIY